MVLKLLTVFHTVLAHIMLRPTTTEGQKELNLSLTPMLHCPVVGLMLNLPFSLIINIFSQGGGG